MIKLWRAEKKDMNITDFDDLTRFNEAIDQALTESISHYTKKLNASKDMFLGILTHDLRNPLASVVMSGQLISKIGPLNERQTTLADQIIDSSARIDEIVSHLLDITRARFGSGLPVIREHMNMAYIARQLVDEARAGHPDHKFELEISGETEGEWDKARIGQVFSNLLGNAVQYSFKDTPIGITVKGDPTEVVLSVHNEGVIIPADKIARIFDSMIRVSAEDKEHSKEQTSNLGLGLFITKEIVTAHGGVLDVTSTEKGGTTFSAHFPLKEPPKEEEEIPAFKIGNGSTRQHDGGKHAH